MSEEHDAELKGEKMVALKTASVGAVSKSAKKSCGLTRSAFTHGEIKARSRTSRISLETGNPARIPREGLEEKCTWRKSGFGKMEKAAEEKEARYFSMGQVSRIIGSCILPMIEKSVVDQ